MSLREGRAALVAVLVAAAAAVALVLALLLGGAGSGSESLEDSVACDTKPGVVYASSGKVRLPVVGSYTYTSPFGMRVHPITGVLRLHAGMDLVSNGDIVAPQAATVSAVIMGDPGAGNFVVLDHGGGITSRYLHLASVSVKPGQKVTVGQKLGVEGTTGGSTGVHLHWEIIKNGTPTNPLEWAKEHGIKVVALGSSGTAPTTSQSPTETVQADSPDTAADFTLLEPASQGQNSLHTKAMSIPPGHLKAYREAGRKYGVPWEVLAGIGMEETHHWRIKAVSSAGALGPMQFTPPTWQDFGVDGDEDGQADILSVPDAIHSAANMLAKKGATESPEGMKKAILRYNNAEWYYADVYNYAKEYRKSKGGGEVTVAAAGDDCGKVDVQMASTATTDCPATKSPAEKGLRPSALNGLRCGAAAAPWVKTMFGLGQRAGATEHDDGLAVDFMIPSYDTPASKARAQKLSKWLRANAKKLGITYIIYDQKIWNIARSSEGWRPMEDRGSDTENHLDHVHVSFADTVSGA